MTFPIYATCVLWAFSHLWRRWAWWRPAHTAETLCGSRWTSVDNGWAPQTQCGEALTGHQRRPSTPTPATWWRQEAKSQTQIMHICNFLHIYVDTLCLLYINEKLLEKVEIPKVQKSSQSEEIHFRNRTLTRRWKYCADRKGPGLKATSKWKWL